MYVCVFVWYAGTHTGMYIYKYIYVCIYTCLCIYSMYLTEIKCSLGLIIYFIFQGWKEHVFSLVCRRIPCLENPGARESDCESTLAPCGQFLLTLVGTTFPQ